MTLRRYALIMTIDLLLCTFTADDTYSTTPFTRCMYSYCCIY